VTGLPSLKNLLEILSSLEGVIDQTMLRVDASEKDYISFVELSERYRFRAIVVPPVLLPVVVPITRYRVCTVAGFPHGYLSLKSKLAEVEYAADAGAREVDVVMNTVLARSSRWSELREELMSLAKLAHELGLTIKIIIETSVLSSEEIRKASQLVEEVGADYIKTNTGFGSRGVVPSDVIIIKYSTSGRCKIKAAGGIRTALDAALLLALGAHVIGTSHGVEIVEQARGILASPQYRELFSSQT
jgi:deoxyribose-phosphate aldolase